MEGSFNPIHDLDWILCKDMSWRLSRTCLCRFQATGHSVFDCIPPNPQQTVPQLTMKGSLNQIHDLDWILCKDMSWRLSRTCSCGFQVTGHSVFTCIPPNPQQTVPQLTMEGSLNPIHDLDWILCKETSWRLSWTCLCRFQAMGHSAFHTHSSQPATNSSTAHNGGILQTNP